MGELGLVDLLGKQFYLLVLRLDGFLELVYFVGQLGHLVFVALLDFLEFLVELFLKVFILFLLLFNYLLQILNVLLHLILNLLVTPFELLKLILVLKLDFG